MRISREEKEKLKEKILAEALPSIKAFGAAGAPVDKIMKSVGLTSGALYSHFESKEDLFHQTVSRELDTLKVRYSERIQKHGSKALEEFIEAYLSEAHVDGVAKGCVFAALGADMHRQKASVRADFEKKLETLFAVLAEGVSKGSEQERIDKVSFIFSSMVGALTYARMMKNKAASAQFLNSTKKQIFKLLN